MLRFVPAAFALALAALPAAADEFTDTLESALKAYASGDITGAREDLDYAGKLLTAMKSEALGEVPAGGAARLDPGGGGEDAAAAGGFMGMLGGGTTAAATYRKGAETLTITLVADSPMVSGLGGDDLRHGRRSAAASRSASSAPSSPTSDGRAAGRGERRVMVSVTGDASLEDKTAHLEAMDFKALGEF